jgi:sulfur carrier protein
MLQIMLNGESKAIDDGVTVAALIDALALRGKRLAVEVNEEVVPRSSYGSFALGDGDRIEIVQAIGGG